MTITPLELAAAMMVPATLVGAILFGLLCRERAARLDLAQKLGAQRVASDRELLGLRDLLYEVNQRELRLTVIIGRLWQVLIKRHDRMVVMKGRYKRVSRAFAGQGVWRRHYRWKAKELEALVKRLMARWEKERRARARESLMHDLVGAILHVLGVPHTAK